MPAPDARRPIHGEIVSHSAFAIPKPRGLRGRYVELRCLDADADAAELFAAAGEADDLWRFMPYGPFAAPERMAEWLQRCALSADPFWLAARTTSATPAAVGMAAFMRVREQVGVAEIGHIWIAPRHQGTRESTEALFLMMDHALTACRFRRLEWKCDALNKRSRGAARRLGFRYEGTFYNHGIVKGRNRDTAWFSILDSEWPPLRARLVEWLDPANFDEAGRQRFRLRALA